MPRRLSQVLKLTVVLLVCAVIGGQAISLVSEQLHHDASQHCCGLCHTGPLPFLQPTTTGGLAPALAVLWIEPVSDQDSSHTVIRRTGGSRAPPESV